MADFFDLGGHSLLLAKLVSALAEETGTNLSIQEIIERPSLGGMARLVEEASGPVPVAPTIVPGLEATGVSILEGGPVVLHDGSRGVESHRRAPFEATAAVAVATMVDLEAEAMRLDASIFPAGTRKLGCVCLHA